MLDQEEKTKLIKRINRLKVNETYEKGAGYDPFDDFLMGLFKEEKIYYQGIHVTTVYTRQHKLYKIKTRMGSDLYYWNITLLGEINKNREWVDEWDGI